MSDDVVEFRVRFRRRTAWILAAAGAVVVLLVAWWVASGTAAVAQGSASWSGGGHPDRCADPDDDVWAVYAQDEKVVAVQTVRNDGRWPVEVVSTRPEVYRFGPVPADPRDDAGFPMDPARGAPPDDETSDRVTIPPGREVPMWIIEPFRASDDPATGVPLSQDARVGVDSTVVQVRSLGIRHERTLPFVGTLFRTGADRGSDEFQAELAQLCETES